MFAASEEKAAQAGRPASILQESWPPALERAKGHRGVGRVARGYGVAFLGMGVASLGKGSRGGTGRGLLVEPNPVSGFLKSVPVIYQAQTRKASL